MTYWWSHWPILRCRHKQLLLFVCRQCRTEWSICLYCKHSNRSWNCNPTRGGYSLAACASIRGGPFFCLVKKPPFWEIGDPRDLGPSFCGTEFSGIVLGAFGWLARYLIRLKLLLTIWFTWSTDMVSHECNFYLLSTGRTFQRGKEP